jgi:hypothetical protein
MILEVLDTPQSSIYTLEGSYILWVLQNLALFNSLSLNFATLSLHITSALDHISGWFICLPPGNFLLFLFLSFDCLLSLRSFIQIYLNIYPKDQVGKNYLCTIDLGSYWYWSSSWKIFSCLRVEWWALRLASWSLLYIRQALLKVKARLMLTRGMCCNKPRSIGKNKKVKNYLEVSV